MGIRFRFLSFLKSPHSAMRSFNVLKLTPNSREEVLLVVCYHVTCDGYVSKLINLIFVLYICVIFMNSMLNLYW
jgi:hypothetical protein